MAERERERRISFSFFSGRGGSQLILLFAAVEGRRPEKNTQLIPSFFVSFTCRFISAIMVSVAATGAALGVAVQVYANAVSC